MEPERIMKGSGSPSFKNWSSLTMKLRPASSVFAMMRLLRFVTPVPCAGLYTGSQSGGLCGWVQLHCSCCGGRAGRPMARALRSAVLQAA